MTYDQIVQSVKAYMINSAGVPVSYRSWYVGITNNPERRLFQEHAVDKGKDSWIYRPAIDIEHARAAEKALLELGCQGGAGGGGGDSIYVYAFKKTRTTNPAL